MATVVILGAGPLGGATAFTLAVEEICSRILLVDEARSVADGKALDVRQACAVAGSDTHVLGAGAEAAVEADLLIVADHAMGGAEWQGETGLAGLARTLAPGTRAPVIFAGAAQSWLLERSVVELGRPQDAVLGTSVLALEGAVRAITALEADRHASGIVLHVVGRPPDHASVSWESALVAGQPALEVLDTAAVRRIEARVPSLWPPAPYALATAATAVVRAILDGVDRTFTCVAVQGDPPTATAVTARLGPHGIRELLAPSAIRARLASGLAR